MSLHELELVWVKIRSPEGESFRRLTSHQIILSVRNLELFQPGNAWLPGLLSRYFEFSFTNHRFSDAKGRISISTSAPARIGLYGKQDSRENSGTPLCQRSAEIPFQTKQERIDSETQLLKLGSLLRQFKILSDVILFEENEVVIVLFFFLIRMGNVIRYSKK